MERIWLAGAFIFAGVTVYYLIEKDFNAAVYFFALFIFASVFYFLRKRQRKRHIDVKNNDKKK